MDLTLQIYGRLTKRNFLNLRELWDERNRCFFEAMAVKNIYFLAERATLYSLLKLPDTQPTIISLCISIYQIFLLTFVQRQLYMERAALTSCCVFLHSKIKKIVLTFNSKMNKISFSLEKNCLLQNRRYFCTYLKRNKFLMFLSLSGKLVLPVCQRDVFSLFNRKIQQILSSDKKFIVSNYRNSPWKCFPSLENVSPFKNDRYSSTFWDRWSHVLKKFILLFAFHWY